MLHAIHHIAIICTDYDKTLNFYHDILGFEIIRSNKREHDWKVDLKLNETTEIELFIRPDAPARPSYPEACGLRHLAFAVESVDETVRMLEEKGVACEPVRFDDYTGKKMTFFRDPDGLPLEIHE